MEITFTHRPDLGDEYHLTLINDKQEVANHKFNNDEAVKLRDFLNRIVKSNK